MTFISILTTAAPSYCRADLVHLYHASDSRNLESIERDGLRASMGGCNLYGASYSNPEDMKKCRKKIFLATTPSGAEEYAKLISSEFLLPPPHDGVPATVFEVLVNASDLERDPDSEDAFFIRKDISPEHIRSVETVTLWHGTYYSFQLVSFPFEELSR